MKEWLMLFDSYVLHVLERSGACIAAANCKQNTEYVVGEWDMNTSKEHGGMRNEHLRKLRRWKPFSSWYR